MTFAQAVAIAQSDDGKIALTILGSAGLVVIGGIGYVIKRGVDSMIASFNEVRESVNSLNIAWWGDPKSNVPNGAYRKLNAVADKIDAHAKAFDAHLQSDREEREAAQRLATDRNNDIHKTLLGIEERLPTRKRQRAAS